MTSGHVLLLSLFPLILAASLSAGTNNTCTINSNIAIIDHLLNKSCSEIIINSDVVTLATTNVITNRTKFKLFGNGRTVIECKQNAGLAFMNTSNIEINNVTFQNCGMLFESTSVNPDMINTTNSNKTTLSSKAALLFEYCQNVSLVSITVKHSDGVGIQMYNTLGKIKISHSSFSENRIIENDHVSGGGGGIYIEFTLCDPGTGAKTCALTNSKYTFNSTYEISFSKFINNNASVTNPERVAFIRAGNRTHFAFGRGGGLSIYLKGNASYNRFIITNCLFENNTALFGAGMFMELQDLSNHNALTVTDSCFASNSVISKQVGYTGTSGGGFMLDYIIFSSKKGVVLYNRADFTNTTFKDNAAFTGGGFSFHSSKENGVSKPTNHLSFTGCDFLNNRARLGAAIDLSILHSSENGQLVKPEFNDCTFEGNFVTGYTIYNKDDAYGLIDAGSNKLSGGYWPGAGVMYLDAITADFRSNVTFLNNTGSAIIAVDAGINIHRNTSVHFCNNHADKGGAVYLSGNSWISVSPDVHVSFLNNSARTYGGAIYAQKSGQHDLVSSANCFIRYTDDTVPPDQWKNVTFEFTDNCAHNNRSGDAIYTTTVVDCAWNGSFALLNIDALKRVFREWPNFTFSSFHGCLNYIQTSARYINFGAVKGLKIVPGKIFQFPFKALNDFNETTSSIFAIFTDNEAGVSIPNPVVQTDGSTLLKTNKTSNFYLQFETVDSRKHVGYINVTVEKCSLGYHLHNGVCECIASNMSNLYEGLAHCNEDELQIYIRPGYWAGTVSGFFSTYTCPVSYCIQNSRPVPLSDNDVLCKGRTGRLCGECKHGYGLAVGTLECVKCTGSHYIAWIILITTTYVPITIVFTTLLVLNINLAVGPIHSFIFFCQVFPAVSLDNNQWGDYSSAIRIMSDIHSALINTMSLKFGVYFTTNYCLFSKMNNLDYFLLQYVSALYPLLIMVIIVIVIRYCPGCILAKYFWYAIKPCVKAIRKRTSIQQTVIHGFVAFMLLTYANFVNISFQFLAFAYFADKTSGHDAVLAPFRQGNMDYFGKEHLPYALVAVTFLIVFGITPLLLLIAYPVILMIIAQLGWDDTSQVRTLRKWIPLYKLMPVLDAFWSEFKPNCQVFAGFYFIYRFLAFAMFSLIPTIYPIYFGISILFTIALFLHAFVQPYKKQNYNRADFFMLAIISIINSFFACSEFLRTQNVTRNTVQTYLWIRVILAWIPIVFIIFYVAFKLRNFCKDTERISSGHDDNAHDLEPLLDRIDFERDDDDDD